MAHPVTDEMYGLLTQAIEAAAEKDADPKQPDDNHPQVVVAAEDRRERAALRDHLKRMVELGYVDHKGHLNPAGRDAIRRYEDAA